MKILEDKGNKVDKHCLKHKIWNENNVEILRFPLPVGDYVLVNDRIEDVIERKQKRNIEIKKMDFLGTYSKTVDSKRDMNEIASNICGKSHARFRDECILAQNNSIKLYILVENTDDIKQVTDVFRWVNPRLKRYNQIKYMHKLGKWSSVKEPTKPPVTGKTLAKAMLTMQKKYGIEFVFCTPDESANVIVELLRE